MSRKSACLRVKQEDRKTVWVNRATPVAQHLHALGLFSFYRVEMSMDYFFQIRKSTNPTKHKKKKPQFKHQILRFGKQPPSRSYPFYKWWLRLFSLIQWVSFLTPWCWNNKQKNETFTELWFRWPISTYIIFALCFGLHQLLLWPPAASQSALLWHLLFLKMYPFSENSCSLHLETVIKKDQDCKAMSS